MASWGPLGPSWCHLKPSWSVLGQSWSPLGLLLGRLGRSWAVSEAALRPLGPKKPPSWPPGGVLDLRPALRPPPEPPPFGAKALSRTSLAGALSVTCAGTGTERALQQLDRDVSWPRSLLGALV